MSSYEEFVQAINEDRNHIMLRSKDGLTAWVNQINSTMETEVFKELPEYLVEGERKEERQCRVYDVAQKTVRVCACGVLHLGGQ